MDSSDSVVAVSVSSDPELDVDSEPAAVALCCADDPQPGARSAAPAKRIAERVSG